MIKEEIPAELEFVPVELLHSDGASSMAQAASKTWTSTQAFWRGFKKSAKIVGVLVMVPLPFGFMEPFAFMVWGSLVIAGLLLVVGPVLHFKYWKETSSFFYVDATCPSCKQKGRLTPYLSTQLEDEFTVLCPNCGQTTRARRT